MCEPWGLIVDKDLNIYTSVSQIVEKRFIRKERYLCKLNSSGDMIDCIKLHDDIYPRDLLLVNNSLILFDESSIFTYS
jgi:aminoglycoside phosphotransferase family enzyme